MLKRKYLLILLALFVQHNVAAAITRYLPRPDAYKVFNLGPGCRFKIKISSSFKTSARYSQEEPFGSAGFDIEGLQPPQGNWTINFRCSKSDGEFANDATAVFRQDQWELNDSEDNKKLIKHNALQFHSVNAIEEHGWAITYDDSFGEEKFRQRNLVYCMIRAKKAICGTSKVGYLESIAKNQKTDFTPYVISLLNSMKFLEDVVPTDNDNMPNSSK